MTTKYKKENDKYINNYNKASACRLQYSDNLSFIGEKGGSVKNQTLSLHLGPNV